MPINLATMVHLLTLSCVNIRFSLLISCTIRTSYRYKPVCAGNTCCIISANFVGEKANELQDKKKKQARDQTRWEFASNPVNDRRKANAVTLKSTFCLPKNQQLFKNI